MPHICFVITPAIASSTIIQRPNVTSYDWNAASFTKDQTYHDLDCSTIVPPGVSWIIFNVELMHTNDNQNFNLRRKSTGPTSIGPNVNVKGGIYYYQTLFCQTDPDRIIQYRASNNPTWEYLNMVVIGWIL